MHALLTSTSRPTTAMAALLADLDGAAAAPLAARPTAIAAALAGHLGRHGLLTAAHRRSSAQRYRTNIIHVDPAGRWSLVALVWRPGQRTPIHSHASWCVVGVHEGREQERSFRLVGERVVETGRRTMARPDVAVLDAADDDIHEVLNASDGITISLHVYGLDYRTAGSSILRTFAEQTRLTA